MAYRWRKPIGAPQVFHRSGPCQHHRRRRTSHVAGPGATAPSCICRRTPPASMVTRPNLRMRSVPHGHTSHSAANAIAHIRDRRCASRRSRTVGLHLSVDRRQHLQRRSFDTHRIGAASRSPFARIDPDESLGHALAKPANGGNIRSRSQLNYQHARDLTAPGIEPCPRRLGGGTQPAIVFEHQDIGARHAAARRARRQVVREPASAFINLRFEPIRRPRNTASGIASGESSHGTRRPAQL